jgi:hypothetical protein
MAGKFGRNGIKIRVRAGVAYSGDFLRKLRKGSKNYFWVAKEQVEGSRVKNPRQTKGKTHVYKATLMRGSRPFLLEVAPHFARATARGRTPDLLSRRRCLRAMA